ncbi:MAG: metal-sulfur cluster assembly factor [bacterium]
MMAETTNTPEVTSAPTAEITEARVIEALKDVYDPEIPVNVVDLGLVYKVILTDGKMAGSKRAYVEMTLTAPGCGMSGMIGATAAEAIRRIPGVEDALVEFIWDPPWDPSKISEDGKKMLAVVGIRI